MLRSPWRGICDCDKRKDYQKGFRLKTDQAIFLLELSSLLEKNKATMSYTTDDDGIHIEADGQEILVGFLSDEDEGKEIYRNVIKKGK